MTLTAKQLTLLRHDLVALATIEYDDVMNELLDHYASLTEQKMANNMPFDEASKWAWAEMGSGTGIQQIQETYKKSILKQVQTQHFHILKSYFRWPTFLTTILVSIFIYLTVPLMPVKTVMVIVLVITISPAVLLGFGYFALVDQRISTGKIIWQYMQKKGYLPLNLLQLGLNLPSFFFDSSPHVTRTFLQQYPTASVVLCSICLLYTISFIQLYRYKFYLKIA